MKTLALIHDDTIISIHQPDNWFDLPDGSRASPAHDGWSDGEYHLAAILPADPVPEGKRVTSSDVQLIEGQPRYVNVLEDVQPPTPEEILASLPSVSHAQMIAALVIHSVITEVEGEAWILGTLPTDVLSVIETLPPELRFVAKLRSIRPNEVSPQDILVPALAAMKDMETEDLINIFQLAATL